MLQGKVAESAEREENVILDELSMFSDLSHAWVVSFVRIEALVDLFSQSGVLLWAPTTQERQSHKSAKAAIRHTFCTLRLHTCGNGLQDTP